MICTVEVRCNAANPNLPLKQFVSFKGSPSSIRVLDVPKKIGEWNITNVYVQVKYPDDTTISKECVRNGSVWIGTVDGTNTIGTSKKGFSIVADGIDEDGNNVSGYVLGVGDVVIMDMDGIITPGETTWSIHLYDSQPENPKKGDAYFDENILKVYDGTQWNSTGSSIVPYSDNPEWAAGAYTATKASLDMLGRQINTTYATKTEIPKKVSDLNDDVGIVHLGENNTARDVSLRYGSVKTQIYNSGMTVAKDSSYNSTYLNYGYGQVIDETGKGTLYVGNGIGIYYDSANNDKPTIKLGDNTVVDD